MITNHSIDSLCGLGDGEFKAHGLRIEEQYSNNRMLLCKCLMAARTRMPDDIAYGAWRAEVFPDISQQVGAKMIKVATRYADTPYEGVSFSALVALTTMAECEEANATRKHFEALANAGEVCQARTIIAHYNTLRKATETREWEEKQAKAKAKEEAKQEARRKAEENAKAKGDEFRAQQEEANTKREEQRQRRDHQKEQAKRPNEDFNQKQQERQQRHERQQEQQQQKRQQEQAHSKFHEEAKRQRKQQQDKKEQRKPYALDQIPHAKKVLGISPLTTDLLKALKKGYSSMLHESNGGDQERLAEINAAIDLLTEATKDMATARNAA